MTSRRRHTTCWASCHGTPTPLSRMGWLVPRLNPPPTSSPQPTPYCAPSTKFIPQPTPTSVSHGSTPRPPTLSTLLTATPTPQTNFNLQPSVAPTPAIGVLAPPPSQSAARPALGLSEAAQHANRHNYKHLNMKNLQYTTHMPFAQGVDPAAGLYKFISSVRLVQAEILAVCDDSGTISLNSARLVTGWHVPLHKSFRRALCSPQAASSDLPRIIDGFFTAVRLHLEIDDTGPSAFRRLLQSLTARFDTGDQGQGFKKLPAYGVPTNTAFSTYLRCSKDLVAIAQGTGRHQSTVSVPHANTIPGRAHDRDRAVPHGTNHVASLRRACDQQDAGYQWRGFFRSLRRGDHLVFFDPTPGPTTALAWLAQPCAGIGLQPPRHAHHPQRPRLLLQRRRGLAAAVFTRSARGHPDVLDIRPHALLAAALQLCEVTSVKRPWWTLLELRRY